MDARKAKAQLKTDLKRVFRALDFVSKHLDGRRPPTATQHSYFDVYQGLGLAWEFLGLQCKHWDGYKRSRDGKQACRVCGQIKGAQDRYFLLNDNGVKRIGRRVAPTSKKTFSNKHKAQIVHDEIVFHGAHLGVDVHNSYKSNLLGKGREITIAADRRVTLKESGVKCSVDEHVVDIEIENPDSKIRIPRYGGFPWEISREKLKSFPVIFRFDDGHRFLGLTILRSRKTSRH